MPTSEARSTPRVTFHAAVELLAQTEDDPAPRALTAEALDLGAGGMRVAVAERLPIGAPLTCRVTLDGRATSLGGHVVWLRSHTSPRPHGMGIRWDELKDHEQRLLSQVIERSSASYRRVQLQFDGTSAAIVARARPHGNGLTLSAPLPILDRGAGVEVRLGADAEAQRGRVGEVRVVESGPQRRLEVEIALGDAEVARFRREARFASGGLEDIPQLHDADHAEGTRQAAPKSANRASMALSLLAALAFGVAGGLAWAGGVPASWPSTPAAQSPAVVRTAASPAATSPISSAARATVTTGSATAIAPGSTPKAPASAASPELATPTPQALTPPSADSAPAVVLPQSPSVSVDADATVLRVPFSGSLEGMVARTWAAPAALALDLPGGRVELGPGTHALHGGSIAGVRVNARGAASLLRVRLAGPIGRYAVSAHDGVLELRVFAAQ